MFLCFIDDAAQRSPSRDGLRPIVATGGIVLPIDHALRLGNELEKTCEAYGFPTGEEFKWSPGRGSWMRDNLTGATRTQFFIDILQACRRHDVVGIVVIAEEGTRRATWATSETQDTVVLFLERVDDYVGGQGGSVVVIADKPGGNSTVDGQFVLDCEKVLHEGTDYNEFESIPINILTAHSHHSRFLQVADLVTSCTTAAVGGENEYAPPVFAVIKEILRRDGDHVGGRGLKLHPHYRLANLYHWLVGDAYFVSWSTGTPLPLAGWPFAESANVFQK